MDLRIAITDDLNSEREKLSSAIIAPFSKVGLNVGNIDEYTSGEELLRQFSAGRYDLIFLDIYMGGMSGVETAKRIRALDKNVMLVFVTTSNEFASESYAVKANFYLLKPVSYPEFLTAANRALQWAELKARAEAASQPQPVADSQHIIVKSEYKLIQIDVSKILYIEGLKDYVKIYTEDSPTCILSLMNMKTIEQHLPADRFIRVHRSFIVQMSKINVIERNRIVFGKKYIPISDTYKKAFSDYLARHTVTAERNQSSDDND